MMGFYFSDEVNHTGNALLFPQYYSRHNEHYHQPTSIGSMVTFALGYASMATLAYRKAPSIVLFCFSNRNVVSYLASMRSHQNSLGRFIFHGESVAAILFRALYFNPAATVRATLSVYSSHHVHVASPLILALCTNRRNRPSA